MTPADRSIIQENLLQSNSLFWFPSYLEPSAWTSHIPFAFWLIDSFRPRTIVELGVYNGTSYFSFCQSVARLNIPTKTYGVDTWRGDEHAGFYEEEVYKNVNTYNNNNYSKFSTLIKSTFDEARSYFSNGTIDLLHIDGLHTYEAVKHDFDTWLPAMAPNAIVLFHDINVRERDFGVYRLWEELCKEYQHFEFDFGHGLGVLALGKNYSPVLQSLFQKNKDAEEYPFLCNLFSERGHFFGKSIEYEFLKNERNDLKREVNKLSEINATVLSDNTALNTRVDETGKTIEELTIQLNVANALIGEKANDLTQLKSDLVNATSESIRLSATIKAREEELLALQHDYRKKCDEELERARLLNTVTDEKERQVRNISEKNAMLTDEVDNLKEQLLHARNLIADSQQSVEQIDTLNKKLDQEIIRNKQYNNQVVELLRELEEIKRTARIRATDKEEVERRMSELQVVYERLIRENSDLRNGVEMLKNENMYLVTQIQSAKKTIEDLNREILLTGKSAHRMNDKKKWKIIGLRERAFDIIAKMQQRFPKLAFHTRRTLLPIKWTLQGTSKDNNYKLEFWKKHRHVPYSLIDNYIAIQQSGLMDPDWYLAAYEDVKASQADPILHYLLFGYYEGRDPGPQFSTVKYINHYPDVRKDRMNPLLHFLYYGKNEGRVAFSVAREENEFPYPVSHSSSVSVPVTELSLQSNNNPIVQSMPHTETDFFKRRSLRADRRSITAIKTVAFVAQPEYFDFHYREILESQYTVRYFPHSFSEDPGFFKPVVEFDADITIFFRGELVPIEVLEALSGLKVNLSSEPFPKIIDRNPVYTEDSLARFEFFLRIFDRPYDYIFHYDEVSRTFFERQGIQLSGFFPFPIATEVITPSNKPKKWDIFFSGRSTPHRDQFFGPLKRDFNFLHINHGVVGSDLLDFIHQCKISLNIHAENEVSWEPRTQFLMAAGSLLVSEPLSPTCPLRPGIDFIEVSEPWKMYETCKHILENYDDYKHIAESGRQRVEEVLSSRKNFPVFFNEILDGKYQPTSFNPNRLKLQPLKVNLKYNGFQHLLTELTHEHA